MYCCGRHTHRLEGHVTVVVGNTVSPSPGTGYVRPKGQNTSVFIKRVGQHSTRRLEIQGCAIEQWGIPTGSSSQGNAFDLTDRCRIALCRWKGRASIWPAGSIVAVRIAYNQRICLCGCVPICICDCVPYDPCAQDQWRQAGLPSRRVPKEQVASTTCPTHDRSRCVVGQWEVATCGSVKRSAPLLSLGSTRCCSSL